MDDKTLEVATFANGCFWCTEAIFQQVKGVESVLPGFSGGSVDAPSYEEVSSESTGHAECLQIKYDPKIISYPELLEVFWHTHDPTTLNRQGNDVGSQYRSAIFYHNKEQQAQAEESKIKAQADFDKPIVTEIVPFVTFYAADEHHLNYYETHPEQAYCQLVISPKIEKFRKQFKDKLKK